MDCEKRHHATGFITSGLPRHRNVYARPHTCSTFFQGVRLRIPRTRFNVNWSMCESPTPADSQAAPRPQRDIKPEVKELRSVLKRCSIFLVGPMGSGKSVVGKYLAYELGFRFLDTDELIEAAAKKSIPEIFRQDGETAFRDLESAVLEQVAPFIGCCVATGGGAVVRKSNWGKLQCGIVVYLSTPVDVLRDRLQGDSGRPLLQTAKAEALRDRIQDILHERRHLYEQADVTVHVAEDMPVDDVGMEVIKQLTNFIKANPPRLSGLYPGNLPKQK